VPNQRVIIVGSGGQDGRILWDQLADQGVALIGVERKSFRTFGTDWENEIIIDDPASVRHLVDEFRPDQIYYLAAHHHSSQDPLVQNSEVWETSWRVHVQGFIHFLEAARVYCPDTRIFYASSSRVFGVPASTPQTEDTPLKPICSYGITKSIAMKVGDYYRRAHKVHVSSGILYNHESPFRGRQFVSQRVAHGLAKIKAGMCQRLEIGNLSARVDWGYAPDYTRAMQLVVEHDPPADFIIASGTTHSVQEMVEIASEILGLDWKGIVSEDSKILQRDPLPVCGDSARLRSATSWKPSTSFTEMVRILVEASQAEILCTKNDVK
jgi:GDPmannose 4,6-dehydratase